jgi:hypothetical protein
VTMHIPDGFGSVAWEYTGTAGTAPYIVTCGIAIPTDVALVDLANFVFTTWTDTWMPNTFSEFTCVRATITLPAPGGGLGSVESNVPSVVGAATGDPALVAVAVLQNKHTGLIGRPGRGRWFIPGLLGEDDVDVSGTLGSSTITLYDGLADNWLADMHTGVPDSAEGVNPYILHSDASLPPSAINDITTSTKVGILRKRLR